MSVHVKYGPIHIKIEKDSEGFAFTCPLCHQMHFSVGDNITCTKVVQRHLQQFHKIELPAATIHENKSNSREDQRHKALNLKQLNLA